MATTRVRYLRRCAELLAATACLLATVPWPAYADPPPWAPAHGWRKKHDAYYTGYAGKKWERDYGIVAGRCDRQAIGAVLGATVGGVIGSQVGKGSGKTVATVLGAVIGGVIGAEIGRDLDGADRGCLGHALELAEDRERVTWVNSGTGVTYVLSPIRGYKRDGRICREFSLKMTAGRKDGTGRGVACQAGDGTWQIARAG
ncbi:MAG: glycine zipper 2TM domain-containing protein, partial [Betaproteobacteria bacterium]|nr:glycine zipper 2TM domain-containing protein [Betaproteobacteria bacterium]